jgi:LacI family transcriptional regulator
MPATINDVASLAGVSKKTVSRVINNESNVRESTRNKVFEAMAQLGYSPNISARRLARNRSHVIGLISQSADDYLTAILGPAIHYGQENGYSILVVLDHFARKNNNEILNLVSQKQVDGFVIIPPCDTNASLLQDLQSFEIPFVVIASSILPKSTPYVICDDRGGAYEITQHLISLGHRRIGLVQGPPDHYASRGRLLGYKDALEKYQIDYNPDWVQVGDFSFESGVQAGKQLLTLPQRPTAIFASNDDSAAGILSVAYEMEIRIPAELSVAGFDDFYLAKRVWPQLTTLHQPINRMACQALEILIGLIENKPIEKKHVTFPVDLVIRNSTGPWKAEDA